MVEHIRKVLVARLDDYFTVDLWKSPATESASKGAPPGKRRFSSKVSSE